MSQERPPLGASITVDALGELPSSANLFSLLDTVVPDVIADRIDTGGLSAGAAARVGAHGSTWTQTIFRVGDADITSPTGTGAPLLIPGVKQWDRVEVATGLMPIDLNAPGMAVSLVPRDPRRTSFRSIEFLGSPPLLNADRAHGRAAGDHAVELVGAHRPVSQRHAVAAAAQRRCCRRRGPGRRGSSEDARP